MKQQVTIRALAIITCLTTTAVGVNTATDTAWATPATTPPASSFAQGPVTELEDQYALLSQSSGESVDSLRVRLKGAPEFDALTTTIANQYPDSYADSAWRASVDSLPMIAFKGAVPPQAAAAIDSLPFPVKVTTSAELNAAEQRATIDKTIEWAESRDAEGYNFGVDPVTGVIDIEASDPAVVGEQAVDSLHEELTEVSQFARGSDLPDLTITSKYVKANGSLQVLTGGAVLYTNRALCTGGFNVRNARTGQTGVTTASHCDDDLTYEGDNILRFAGHADGQALDVQWFTTTGDGVWNQFIIDRIDGKAYRAAVTGVSTPNVNSFACKFGAVTLNTCSSVYARGRVSDFDTPVIRKDLLVTENEVSKNGDSGGPWYQGPGRNGGNTAAGFHTAGYELDGKRRSWFTDANALQVYTDLRIVTR